MLLFCLVAGAWTSGCDRDAPPSPPINRSDDWFQERAAASGLDFAHKSGHVERYLLPEIMSGGAALFDMDRDGDLDIYLVQGGPVAGPDDARPGNCLYRNDGSGHFVDISDGSGADDRGYGMGVATGDMDGDGDLDLYVTNCGPNALLRNDGDGHFTDVTDTAQVGDPAWSASAVFLDYDRDGDLDLFVTNYINWTVATELLCYNNLGQIDYCSPGLYSAPTADTLYRNNGDGTFSDSSAEAGIIDGLGTGLGVVADDFTGDGLVDIFVANDGMMDRLWVADGTGHFTDQALELGCAVDFAGQPKAGMGVTAADYDDDGDVDLLVCNLQSQSDSFFSNTGGTFVDMTSQAGLSITSRAFTRFGMAWVDFNNDGRLDLYQANGRVTQGATAHSDDPFAEPNLLFRGTASVRFEEVTPRGGTRELLIHTSRAAAFGDVNNDGAVDVLVVNRDAAPYLLLNRVGRNGNWIVFSVVNGKGSDALGARVTIITDHRTITRRVRSAYSYLSANDPRVHLGLGSMNRVQQVNVEWPDGAIERFGGFQANAIHTLRRGQGEAEKVPAS